MTVKRKGGEAFLCHLPVPIQTQHETMQTGFMVFLQDDTFSHFTLMLSPTVCDISVENSDLLTPDSFVTLSPLLTFIQHVSQVVRSTIFKEKLLCPEYLARPSREFRD